MKKFFRIIVLQLILPLTLIFLCYWLYRAVQKEHTTSIFQYISYKAGITFEDYALNIIYNEKGDDDLRCGTIYEMDSTLWAKMKAAGEDMLIKDAIIIIGVPDNTTPFEGQEGQDNIKYHFDRNYNFTLNKNGIDRKYHNALRFDIDFTNDRQGNIFWNYKSDVFGSLERNFKIYYDFYSFSEVLEIKRIVDYITVYIPPDMEIKTSPEYSKRTPEGVFFEGDVMDDVYYDGLYMEGVIPSNTKRYDSLIFFLGAFVGALASIIVSSVPNSFNTYKRINSIKKIKRENCV